MGQLLIIIILIIYLISDISLRTQMSKFDLGMYVADFVRFQEEHSAIENFFHIIVN